MTTKEKILNLLNEEEFVSGEEIASKCQISRAGIHKAITSLRNDGFVIEAVTNKGYKIESKPDSINEIEIQNELKSLFQQNNKSQSEIGKIFAYEEIDSTNTEAKRRCATVGAFRDANFDLTEGGKTLHKALFVSGYQTQGRGRMGRVFVSPKNSGVYFSYIYSPKNGVTNPALLTAAAAVSVSKAISELYNLDAKIKWVNDIFLSDKNGNFKKVCGILTEGIANFETGRIESAIVGIGINVRNGNFSEEVSKIAGSIEDFTENFSQRNKIVARVIFHLQDFYDKMESQNSIKEMINEYKEKSMLIGKEVTVNPAAGLQGESYKATVIDISDSAELIVKTKDEKINNLHSGEVSLHSYDFVS